MAQQPHEVRQTHPEANTMELLSAVPTVTPVPFTVRPMSRAEMDLAINWAGREGWNPGLHDADAFYSADPNGVFVGVVDDRPVGCICAVAYDATFGFIGLHLVRPEYRRHGYGLQLWRAASAYLGDRLIGFDAVAAQQQKYEEAGFKPAYRTIRFEGTGGGQLPDGVIELAGVPFDEVLAYDSTVFPVARARFLRQWLKMPGSIAYGVAEKGRLAGFGVMRPARVGYKIGPLCADSPELAERLYRALASRAPAVTLFLDTPSVNEAGITLARRLEMKPLLETVRMYSSPAPALPLQRVFGVASLELG
jgi:GNAT superfamily N-acetyltransferase